MGKTSKSVDERKTKSVRPSKTMQDNVHFQALLARDQRITTPVNPSVAPASPYSEDPFDPVTHVLKRPDWQHIFDDMKRVADPISQPGGGAANPGEYTSLKTDLQELGVVDQFGEFGNGGRNTTISDSTEEFDQGRPVIEDHIKTAIVTQDPLSSVTKRNMAATVIFAGVCGVIFLAVYRRW